MLRVLTSFHLWAFILPIALAQTSKTDSLQQRAAALPPGEEKVATLLALSRAQESDNLERALTTARSAAQLARNIRFTEGMVQAYLAQSGFYRKDFNYSAAHRACDQAIQLAGQSRDSLLLSDALFEKGFCYFFEGKHQECNASRERAVAISEKIGREPAFLAAQYARLGSNLRNTGEFDKALAFCNRGLELYRQLKIPAGEFFALTQLSLVYAKMGDNPKALELGEQSLKLARESKEPYRQVVALHNVCDWNLRLGNLETALQLTQQLDTLNHLLENPDADIEFYKLRGRIFFAMKDAEQALVNYNKALAIGIKMKNPYILTGVWEDMTPPLLERNQASKAEAGLQDLLQKLEATKDTVATNRIRLTLGKVKENLGDLETAAALYNGAANWYAQKGMLQECGEAYAELAELHLRASQTGQALEAAGMGLTYFEKTHSKIAIANAHQLLYRAYKQQADFANALLHYEQSTTYLDSVKTEDLQRRLAQERIRQNVEDIETEKARAQHEAQLLATQNRLYLALGGALLAILLAGAYFFWRLRAAKNQLNAQNIQLAQLNQTKDKFFSIIAHDLRSPLAAFQGVGEQLNFYLEKGNLPKLHQISDLLSRSATSLSTLLDNLLSWALLNRGMIPYHPEPVDIGTVVAENFDVYEHAATAKGIRLENQVPGNLLVQADPNALQAILRNLIGNAIKFTPSGQNGAVTVGCTQRDNKVFITVNDTGTGIAAEKLDKLFSLEKRPERGTAGEKGAGLGLVLCKELVEMNKGLLRVFSTKGRGASVEFSLPLITT
ncbi:MAG: tetratricopeptide repeat protein [Lewinellaceae bacterium]|nr:tetratricopeptide repeat protein [Lewinellaceae bacterium]